MSDDEVTEFVIGRLSELIVVLLAEHVSQDPKADEVRDRSRAILVALGNWAAAQGRADLLPMLHGLANKIEAKQSADVPEPGTQPETMSRAQVQYRW